MQWKTDAHTLTGRYARIMLLSGISHRKLELLVFPVKNLLFLTQIKLKTLLCLRSTVANCHFYIVQTYLQEHQITLFSLTNPAPSATS